MIRSPSHKELERRYTEWATEDLVEAVTFEADGYIPGAVEVMRDVLDARNVPESESLQIQSDIQAGREAEAIRLGRIRGWLVVFIVSVALVSLSELLSALTLAGSGSAALSMMALLFGAMGVYGGYVTYVLIERRPQAPAHAQRWILLTLFINVSLIALAYWIAGVLLSGPEGLASNALIGLTYLQESKRVALVYGTDRQESCVQPPLGLAGSEAGGTF